MMEIENIATLRTQELVVNWPKAGYTPMAETGNNLKNVKAQG